MILVRAALILLVSTPLASAVAPAYSLASVVNAATGLAGDFAPNSMVSVYGTNLSYGTQTAGAGQVVLPRILASVQVIINGGPANLFFVSPTQINFLIPSLLIPGPVEFYIAREGVPGPVLTLVLSETAPGLFESSGTAIATHADGRLLTDTAPGEANEIIVLYAAGLGRTSPDSEPGRAASRAAPIVLLSRLIVLLASRPVDPGRVLYAGITPGSAGLYQINLKIPADVSADPEIRVFIGLQGSPSFLKLPVRVQ